MAKGRGPSLVPFGRPTLTGFHEEVDDPIFTHCSHEVRNDFIHLIMTGLTCNFKSSSIMTLWSTRSALIYSSMNHVEEINECLSG
jgi:hypothetical protein